MRILKVELCTLSPLRELWSFYAESLGLPSVVSESRLRVTVGRSELLFRPLEEAGSGKAPFYHLAFNIPENQLSAARRWQLERTPLILPREIDGLDLRDPELPDDVAHFGPWNAHSVFFWDPAGNLLEHIARHDLDNASPGDFGSENLLGISEIGLVVEDVPRWASELRRGLGASQYRQANEEFTALGDEEGLLLLLGRGRTLGFGEGKPGEVYPVEVTVEKAPNLASGESLSLPGYPYRITCPSQGGRSS
jgi:catechol-2,3-dioxygenase